MSVADITVEQMRKYAPGPWAWKVDDPADLPPAIAEFVRNHIAQETS